MPSMMKQKDFEAVYDPDVKLNILFEYTADIYELLCKKERDCETRLEGCNDKFKLLESRKRTDMTISGVFGFVGGFIAGIARTIFRF